MPTPIDKDLYKSVVEDAKKRFHKWPSAYASGWVVNRYKSLGGKYQGKESRDLARWFKEEWVNVCELPKVVPCGRKTASSLVEYPYCRPMRRVSPSTPKTVGELTPKELQQRCNKKRSAPTKILRVKTNLNNKQKRS